MPSYPLDPVTFPYTPMTGFNSTNGTATWPDKFIPPRHFCVSMIGNPAFASNSAFRDLEGNPDPNKVNITITRSPSADGGTLAVASKRIQENGLVVQINNTSETSSFIGTFNVTWSPAP